MGDLWSAARVSCGALSFGVRTCLGLSGLGLSEGSTNRRRAHRHATLRKTHVNKYALVYHWQGSDESLKPALLTAHQGRTHRLSWNISLTCTSFTRRCACGTVDCRSVEPSAFLGLLRRYALYHSCKNLVYNRTTGEYIWGRGSCDDKPGLIGTLCVSSYVARLPLYAHDVILTGLLSRNYCARASRPHAPSFWLMVLTRSGVASR